MGTSQRPQHRRQVSDEDCFDLIFLILSTRDDHNSSDDDDHNFDSESVSYPDMSDKSSFYSSGTTTTTRMICGPSCLNQSWLDSSNALALWPFDGSFLDTTGAHNGIVSRNPPTFATGYVRQAALFNASAQQAIYTSFIPLNNRSFTVEAWIQPTGLPNPVDHSIVGLCPAQTVSQCLHINIRSTKLYFGFFFNDIRGNTTILPNQWIHVAFAYDAIARTQTIYLNGLRDAQNTGSNVLGVASGNITIAANERVDAPQNYFQVRSSNMRKTL